MLQGITVTYLDCRMCSLLYYWDDTIAQVIIFVHHRGVMPMVKVHYVRFNINIMGLFGCSLLMLKWMSTLFLCCYRDAGVSLLFISYFP